MFIFEPNAKIDVLETKYSKTHILRHSGVNNNLLCIIHTTIWKWVPQFCTRQMSTTKINWCLKEAVFNYTQTALLHYCKLKLHNTSLSVVEDSSTENKEHLNHRYMETPPIWFMCLLFFFLPLIQFSEVMEGTHFSLVALSIFILLTVRCCCEEEAYNPLTEVWLSQMRCTHISTQNFAATAANILNKKLKK